jgi:hypothetical protein
MTHGSRELLDIKFDSLKFEKFDPKLPVQADFMAGVGNAGCDYGNGTTFGNPIGQIPNTFPGLGNTVPSNLPIINSGGTVINSGGPPNQTISPNQTLPNGEPDSTGLPEGWQMMWDPRTSRMFYIDHNTKRTTWNDPRSLFFETNSMDTGYDNSISHAQNNNNINSGLNSGLNLGINSGINSGQYQFQPSSGHQPQTSFDSQVTGNSNSLPMDSRNASQDTNQNLMGSSNSLNKPPVRPSNLGVASKVQVKQEPFGYQNAMGTNGSQINHQNFPSHQFQNQQHFQNNQNCPPENSHQSHNPPPNLTVTLPSQQITPNTSFNTHSQQYNSNNNDNNNNFHQYDDQTITPTVQNQMPGFQMDVNITPTPGGVNGIQPDFQNFHNTNPNLHQNSLQNRQSLVTPNSGVLGSPVLPDDLCDELVELLFSGGHNMPNKQTHL